MSISQNFRSDPVVKRYLDNVWFSKPQDAVDASELLAGTVLITGATGVIGTALGDLFEGLGVDVVAASSEHADLRSFEEAQDLFSLVRPTSVIHLAGKVRGVMGNRIAQGEMYFDNLRINTNVVEAARVSGVGKFVAMGSVSVYADGLAQPMREEDVWANAPHHSESGYAQAKRSMLAQLEAYKDQYGMNYAFAVSTNLFGPNDRFDERGGHVVPSLVSKFHRAITEGTALTVWGSGTPTRDFLYSKDAARALLTLLIRGEGVYNLASGRQITIRELVETLSKVTNFNGDLIWDTSMPDGQASRSYNIERLTGLGWRSEVDLEHALIETFDWYIRNLDSARRSVN